MGASVQPEEQTNVRHYPTPHAPGPRSRRGRIARRVRLDAAHRRQHPSHDRDCDRPDVDPTADRVAADPTDIPDPIDRDSPAEVDVTLRSEEVVAEVEGGVTFSYMTYGGQVPGPFIRVRQGDTLNLILSAIVA